MRSLKSKILAIDFDGTCVRHEFPEIGEDIGAIPVLKRLMEQGHKLILFTVRSDKPLHDAVEWLTSRGVELSGVNVNKGQHHWSKSPKVYAHAYIDDAALGTPLLRPTAPAARDGARPFVDWAKMEQLLINEGYLPFV